MKNMYTNKHLREALRFANELHKDIKIPYSKPSFYKLLRMGVIKKPKKVVEYDDRSWAFYTEAELAENVDRVVSYIKQRDGKEV